MTIGDGGAERHARGGRRHHQLARITTVAVFLPLGLRGRHRQPVLPALRPGRHLRPAGLAHRGPHGHPGAGLLVRGPHEHASSAPMASCRETIWQRLYTPVLVRGPAQPPDQVGHAGHRRGALRRRHGPRAAAADGLHRRRRRELPERHRVAAAGRLHGRCPATHHRRPRTILLADPDVELVQSTIPGDEDTGAQALQAAFAGRASNSAVITVRLVRRRRPGAIPRGHQAGPGARSPRTASRSTSPSRVHRRRQRPGRRRQRRATPATSSWPATSSCASSRCSMASTTWPATRSPRRPRSSSRSTPTRPP